MTKLKNEDSVAIQKRLLKALGMWPRESPTFTYKLRAAFSYFVVYINFLAMFHTLFTTKDHHKFIRNFNFFLGFLTDTMKITIFYFNWPKFLKLLDFLQRPVFYSYHEDLEKHLIKAIKTSADIMKTFQVIIFSTIIFIFSVPLFSNESERQLPFDYGMVKTIENYRFLHVTVYAFQGLVLILVAVSNVAIDGIASGLMGLAAAHFGVLQGTISQVTKSLALNKDDELTVEDYGRLDEKINKKLEECVNFHTGIIRFAETIEEMFTYTFLFQFLVSGVSICVAGFLFITTSPRSFEFLMTLGVLGTFLFQITIHCVSGDEVAQQSLKVQDACYATDWNYCGPKVRKTLFIIMERSKRPSVITAGKFVKLSLITLVSTLRSAFSYGTVLQQFYNK